MIPTITKELADQIKNSKDNSIIFINGEKYDLVTRDCCSMSGFIAPLSMAEELIKDKMPKQLTKIEYFGFELAKQGDKYLLPRYRFLIAETEIVSAIITQKNSTKTPFTGQNVKLYDLDCQFTVAWKENDQESSNIGVIDKNDKKTSIYSWDRKKINANIPIKFYEWVPNKQYGTTKEIAIEKIELG